MLFCCLHLLSIILLLLLNFEACMLSVFWATIVLIFARETLFAIEALGPEFSLQCLHVQLSMWDLRMRRPVLRFLGHSNSFRKCKSVVGGDESLLVVGETEVDAKGRVGPLPIQSPPGNHVIGECMKLQWNPMLVSISRQHLGSSYLPSCKRIISSPMTSQCIIASTFRPSAGTHLFTPLPSLPCTGHVAGRRGSAL